MFWFSGGSGCISGSEGSVSWSLLSVGIRGASLKGSVSRMREALQLSGVDITQHSGHSFRIGAATTAAVVRIEESLIRTLGRWESAAYLLYVRVPHDKLAGLSRHLSGGAGGHSQSGDDD